MFDRLNRPPTHEMGVALIGLLRLLCLYSDGVEDVCDASEELFGEDRLHESLRAVGSASAKEVLETVLGRLREFRGSAPAVDDVTLVVWTGKR